MIATALALVLAGKQDLPAAKDLVGRMFLKYYNSTTAKGHIKFTLAASTGVVFVDTDLQLQRPGKLYIHQVESGSKSQDWLVTADGIAFTYNPPRGGYFTNDSRLLEKMGAKEAVKDLKDAYVASVLSIGDRSVPLDIAIGRSADLDHFRYQLATIKTEPEVEVNGKQAFVVDGDWREYGNGPVVGKYQIYISKDGDLYRYVVSQVVRVPGANLAPQQLLQTWDVNLTIDGPVDQSLFTVVKSWIDVPSIGV